MLRAALSTKRFDGRGCSGTYGAHSTLPALRVVSVAESQAGQAWSTYGRAFDNVVANAMDFVPSLPGALQAETLPLTLTVTVGYAFE